MTETGTKQEPYKGPIPEGAGVAGVTLWPKARREAWFKQVAKQKGE